MFKLPNAPDWTPLMFELPNAPVYKLQVKESVQSVCVSLSP